MSFRAAAAAHSLDSDLADALWEDALAIHAARTAALPAPVGAPVYTAARGGTPRTTSRTSPSAALYWTGGMIVVLGLLFFAAQAWSVYGPISGLVASVGYTALFVAGLVAAERAENTLLAGLAASAVTVMAPVVAYMIMRVAGVWDGAQPTGFEEYHVTVRAGWVTLEAATLVVGALMLSRTGFWLVSALLAFTAWYVSMDLAPLVFGDSVTGVDRAWLSLVVGAWMMGVAAWFHHAHARLGRARHASIGQWYTQLGDARAHAWAIEPFGALCLLGATGYLAQHADGPLAWAAFLLLAALLGALAHRTRSVSLGGWAVLAALVWLCWLWAQLGAEVQTLAALLGAAGAYAALHRWTAGTWRETVAVLAVLTWAGGSLAFGEHIAGSDAAGWLLIAAAGWAVLTWQAGVQILVPSGVIMMACAVLWAGGTWVPEGPLTTLFYTGCGAALIALGLRYSRATRR